MSDFPDALKDKKTIYEPEQLTDKVAIVTGANTGIGFQTALQLAKKGCHVILACRSEEKGKQAAAEIQKQTNNEKVEFMKLDLSSLKSVQLFVEEYRQRDLPIHILINNAGVVTPFGLTEDEIEMQMGTNHFGHALLNLSLMDIIEKSQPSRIVFVSSEAHRSSPLESFSLEKINDPTGYSSLTTYGNTKLCNALFASALASRVEDKQIYVNSLHPGAIVTDIARNMSLGWVFNVVVGFLSFLSIEKCLSLQDGAISSVYVATSPDIVQYNIRGQYFIQLGRLSQASEKARNKEMQESLWSFTFDVLKSKLGDKFQPKIQ